MLMSKEQTRLYYTEQIYDGSGKVRINFDLLTLKTFVLFVISENKFIKRCHISNMKNLMDMCDETVFGNDPLKQDYFKFIKRCLEAKCVHKMTNRAIILNYINDGGPDLVKEKELVEIGTGEIEWAITVIDDCMAHAYMYIYVDPMQEVCARFKAEDFHKRSQAAKDFKDLIYKINRVLKKNESESLGNSDFSLEPSIFENRVLDVYQRQTNDSRKVFTGMQAFNELCGGGLEGGRVYALAGLAGMGKSLTLLNIAKQIKKYNPLLKPKDKTKIPTVVILTMENSVEETVTRLFSIVSNDRMENFTEASQVLKILKEDGELQLTNESPINIYIKYKKNNSVDTSYLYDLYDELFDKGMEMICLIQDHLKRIRPMNRLKDMRLDLGEVINDFKAFAIEKDIPVLTNTHLNRNAAKVAENAMMSNKSKDITKLFNRSDIGESLLIIDNTDCTIIINTEYDKDGNGYIVFNRVKMRDFHTKLQYAAHPFVEDSSIALVEDVGKKSVYKESLFNPTDINMGLAEEEPKKTTAKLDEDDEEEFDLVTADDGEVVKVYKKPRELTLEKIQEENEKERLAKLAEEEKYYEEILYGKNGKPAEEEMATFDEETNKRIDKELDLKYKNAGYNSHDALQFKILEKKEIRIIEAKVRKGLGYYDRFGDYHDYTEEEIKNKKKDVVEEKVKLEDKVVEKEEDKNREKTYEETMTENGFILGEDGVWRPEEEHLEHVKIVEETRIRRHITDDMSFNDYTKMLIPGIWLFNEYIPGAYIDPHTDQVIRPCIKFLDDKEVA